MDVYEIRVVDSTSAARNPGLVGVVGRADLITGIHCCLWVPSPTALAGGLMECHPCVTPPSPGGIVKASGSANAKTIQAFCCVDCSGCCGHA